MPCLDSWVCEDLQVHRGTKCVARRGASTSSRARSALFHPVEDWLDIDNGGRVEGLEIEDLESGGTPNLGDSHAMNTHWVRPVLRPSTEHATQRSILVIPRMHAQEIAMGAVQPR